MVCRVQESGVVRLNADIIVPNSQTSRGYHAMHRAEQPRANCIELVEPEFLVHCPKKNGAGNQQKHERSQGESHYGNARTGHRNWNQKSK